MKEYSDWSGLIHLKIFEVRSYEALHHHGIAKVHPDYVLVGGGAQVYGIYHGAYLTESRPNTDLNAWHAKSKDHVNSDPHVLITYAIGMKINGITPAYLRSKMRVFSKDSNAANHPSTNVSVPSNYLLLGGGAEVKYSGNGNLLVHSYPKVKTWYVKSKDHQVADRATIKAYAIGIQNISFPNVGRIETFSYKANKHVNSGSCLVSTPIPSGWALTCPGGEATFNGEGRMLMGIYPKSPSTSMASSKDHNHASSGSTSAYAVRVQKCR